MTATWEIREGDALERLREMLDESIQCCVTSPPYFGLRDYGVVGQIGLEATPDEFVARLVGVFREVRRVLRSDGTLWLNIGDSYAGSWGAQSRPGNFPSAKSTLTTNNGRGPKAGDKYSALSATQIAVHPKGQTRTGSIPEASSYKAKDLLGIPWLLAFALRADGWYLRSDIIWAKPNPMPESVTDRPTTAHEHVFLLAKSARYFYDADAIREQDGGRPSGNGFEPERLAHRISGGLSTGNVEHWLPGGGRNKRNVWEIATQPYPEAHFATFPPKLIEPCVLAGSSQNACGVCGTAWKRVVDVESRPNWSGNGNQKHDGTYYRENIGGGVGNDRRNRRDLGWQPSCEHDDNTAHSVILDPFAGAGTTGLVALRHDRSFIGIELSPAYAEMARERIRQDAPLLNIPAEIAA